MRAAAGWSATARPRGSGGGAEPGRIWALERAHPRDDRRPR
jgi:hypothetical protein